MTRKKKWIIIALCIVLITPLLVYAGLVVYPIVYNHFFPPAEFYLYTDADKATSLARLKDFREETITGNEDPVEAERIAYKNALMQEYRDYVDALCGRAAPGGELYTHDNYLVDLYQKLERLDPGPTPEKLLENCMKSLLSDLIEKQRSIDDLKAEGYEEAIASNGVNVPELKACIDEISAFLERIDSEGMTFEEIRTECPGYLERAKIAVSFLYDYDSVYEELAKGGERLVSFELKDVNSFLGYADALKGESTTGDNSEEDERIARKDALQQEYRDYVDSLLWKTMTYDEMIAHKKHLVNLLFQLSSLEPGQGKKQLVDSMNRLLHLLKVDLGCSKSHGKGYGKDYIKNSKLNVKELRLSIDEITALLEKTASEDFSFEDALPEYLACLERVKVASPERYPLFSKEFSTAQSTT